MQIGTDADINNKNVDGNDDTAAPTEVDDVYYTLNDSDDYSDISVISMRIWIRFKDQWKSCSLTWLMKILFTILSMLVTYWIITHIALYSLTNTQTKLMNKRK